MAIKQLYRIIFGIVAIATVVISVLIAPVRAESVSANASQGLEISPALLELNATRGNAYTIKLSVTNVTASDLVYSTSVDDFNAKDETGTPHILIDNSLPLSASIKSWVMTLPSFRLHSRQAQTVTAQVTIPNNAEPGGHYGVLRFSGGKPELDQTNVGLSASAGVLILIRVDGLITEKANIASFYSSHNDKQTSFFEQAPITLVTRIKNEGNIHIKPVGNIELRDMFGRLVKMLPVNGEKSNVLPDSIRRFESTYDGGWMIGRYTASLALGYGTTGQALMATTSFWVIPYKLILIALLVLVTSGYILSKVIKAYNRHIIAKSKNENTTKNKKHSQKD